jgi:hypothetical protein
MAFDYTRPGESSKRQRLRLIAQRRHVGGRVMVESESASSPLCRLPKSVLDARL